jgi:hypothetical protein
MAGTLGNALISVRDSGVHEQYGGNQCVTDRVDDYLINGILPASRSECPGAEARPPVPPDQAGPQAEAKNTGGKTARTEETLGHRPCGREPGARGQSVNW